MIISKSGQRCVGAALLLVQSLLASTALAQTVPSPSQTPPGERVERRSPDAQINLRVGGTLTAPEGAETVQLTLSSVTIDGGIEPVASEVQRLLPAAGAQIMLADVYRLAGQIQQTYLDAGYPLVRVFVPVQDLDRSQARITIRVVSGYVSRVDVDALDRRVRGTVRRFLTRLVDQRSLRADDLERAVLLAGDVAGIRLATALTPGSQTGETILVASGEFRAVQAVLSVDNRLSPELGREQVTASFLFNSVLGMGERIGTTYATALDDFSLGRRAIRSYAGAFVDLPLGNDGLVVGLDTSASTSRPRGIAALLALFSRYFHVGGNIAYPLVRSRTSQLIATAGFELNRETQESLLLGFPVPLSRDQTRVLRFDLNASYQPSRHIFARANLQYSGGLDILGARRRSDATVFEPLSRIGADATFNKIIADLVVESQIPSTPLRATAHLRAQTGFGKPLLRSEQLIVNTPDLVSGPPTGSLAADSGIAARFQLEAPLAANAVRIAPYAFAAMARARLEQPTLLELRVTDITAFGAGVRTAFPLAGGLSISGQLEYSRTNSDDRGIEGNWLTFQIALRY